MKKLILLTLGAATALNKANANNSQTDFSIAPSAIQDKIILNNTTLTSLPSQDSYDWSSHIISKEENLEESQVIAEPQKYNLGWGENSQVIENFDPKTMKISGGNGINFEHLNIAKKGNDLIIAVLDNQKKSYNTITLKNTSDIDKAWFLDVGGDFVKINRDNNFNSEKDLEAKENIKNVIIGAAAVGGIMAFSAVIVGVATCVKYCKERPGAAQGVESAQPNQSGALPQPPSQSGAPSQPVALPQFSNDNEAVSNQQVNLQIVEDTPRNRVTNQVANSNKKYIVR